MRDKQRSSTRGRKSERDATVEALFDEQYLALRGLASVILGNSGFAEEVVQEAFLKVCASWPSFSKAERPAAYLKQTVVNLCRSKLRRQRLAERVAGLLHEHRENVYASHEADAMDVRIDLWNAVRRLPERQRLSVVLRYLEDLPEREIAELMQCSVGTVKSQLHRAKVKLEITLGAGTRRVSDE